MERPCIRRFHRRTTTVIRARGSGTRIPTTFQRCTGSVMANKNLDKRRPTRSTDAVTVNYDASDVCDFSEEQRLLREQMRLFASRDVQPLARTLDIEARFPVENWRRGAELGLLGMAAPTEYGGSALGLVEMVIVAEELAAVCVSTAVSLLHQADLVIKRLVHHGTSEQKERWLPALCDGSKV